MANCSNTTARKKAATLTCNVIKHFRQNVWNPWCKTRKQWEKSQPQSHTLQATTPSQSIQRTQPPPPDTSHHLHPTPLMEIMEGYLKPPTIVHVPVPIPPDSQIIVPPTNS